MFECKRCGKTLCNFVRETFPFAGDFQSAKDPEHDTTLWHIFYDGTGWTQSPLTMGPTSDSTKRRWRDLLGWHHTMFGPLLALIAEDLRWVWHMCPRGSAPSPQSPSSAP